VRFGVDLPGPFWASFNLGGRRGRGRRTSGNSGCLTGLLTLFFLPVYLIAKLYQFAWGKPPTRRGKILSVSGVSVGLLILLIIGLAAGGGSSSPTPSSPSPVASVVPVVAQVSPTSSPTHKAAASKSPAPPATSAAAPSSSPAPVRTQAPATTAPTTAVPVVPTTAAPAAPTTAAPAAPSCSPLTSGGNCYRPGEFCPAKDHGVTGTAGDGKPITCEEVNGYWRWED
jgi:cytoskeletal protein RodZ